MTSREILEQVGYSVKATRYGYDVYKNDEWVAGVVSGKPDNSNRKSSNSTYYLEQGWKEALRLYNENRGE